jgi:tRNA threonylcarbamoyl adenosine modification protein (Sua5/YciO/YrdC/YwlC family)
MAIHLYTYDSPPSIKDIARAVKVLESGGLIIYPSDVNWAVACDATNSAAVERVFRLKPAHPRDKPLSLLMYSISQVSEYAQVSTTAYRVLKKLLPGPYTFILTRAKNLPKPLGDKRKSVGVRIPNSPLVLALLEAFGKPLASGSLPLPDGRTEFCTKGYEIEECFGHGVDLILDLGESLSPLETTIVDLTEEPPKIERTGLGSVDWLLEIGAKV